MVCFSGTNCSAGCGLYNGHTLWQVSRVVTSVQTHLRERVTEPDTIGTDTWLQTSRMASCTTDLEPTTVVSVQMRADIVTAKPLPRRLLPPPTALPPSPPLPRRRRHLRRRHFSSTSQILISPTQKTDGTDMAHRGFWLERFAIVQGAPSGRSGFVVVVDTRDVFLKSANDHPGPPPSTACPMPWAAAVAADLGVDVDTVVIVE